MRRTARIATAAAITMAVVGLAAPTANAATTDDPPCNSGASVKDDAGYMHYMWNNCSTGVQKVLVYYQNVGTYEYCVDPGVQEVPGAWYSPSGARWEGEYCDPS